MGKIKWKFRQYWKVGGGLIAAMFVGAWLQIALVEGWNHFWSLIETYQTMIVGTAATVAAILSLRAIWTQIIDQRESNKELQYKKSLAARAALPNALSRFCRYTEECVRHLSMDPENIQQLPEEPLEATQAIKEAIEFVDHQSAQILYHLLVCYQIQRSRLENVSSWLGDHERANRVCDAADLRYLSNSLYEFARREEDAASPRQYDEESVLQALRNCIGELPEFPVFGNARDIFKRRFSHAQQSGEAAVPIREIFVKEIRTEWVIQR